MPDIVASFVKNGVVVPNAPLPEGAFVEVHVIHGPIEVPYLENGKYQQAEEIAETAHELAPDDPRTLVALKVSHHQQTNAVKEKADQKLEKLLNKLDQLEQHVRDLEIHEASLEKQVSVLKSRNERLTRGSQPPHEEPRGSPDRVD
jgi:hypothetical protein